jgi:hypothetical protein
MHGDDGLERQALRRGDFASGLTVRGFLNDRRPDA